MKGVLTMPDAPSKIRWDAENVRIFTVKFMRKTDEDVIEFLEPRNKRNTLLKAIRYYMENHPDELKGEK